MNFDVGSIARNLNFDEVDSVVLTESPPVQKKYKTNWT